MGGFHDSCIHEVHVATGRWVGVWGDMSLLGTHVIHLLIQSQIGGPDAVELRFDAVSAYSLATLESNDVIFGATMLSHEGMWYWADTDDFRPGFARAGTTWIAAERIAWRDASDWLGREARYLPAAPA
jgi:hypothetical protein